MVLWLQCGSVTLELVHQPEEPGDNFFPSDNWRTENRGIASSSACDMCNETEGTPLQGHIVQVPTRLR